MMETLSMVMERYLMLIKQSTDIDPVLINFYVNFTEQCSIYLQILCNIDNFSTFL